MFPHCFPLWIADPAANPVYFSRRMRQNLGLSLESHSLGNLRWASLIADGVFEPVIPGPGEIKGTCREYRLADGSTETMLTYVRELRFNGSLVGYIGSTMPLKEGATRSMEPRMPAAHVPSATVRLGIDLYGVAMNHVDAYAKALHPCCCPPPDVPQFQRLRPAVRWPQKSMSQFCHTAPQ
jgi:hypothetical protein